MKDLVSFGLDGKYGDRYIRTVGTDFPDELYLFNCKVTDISPLKGLKNLTKLNLGNCPIEDFSPLSELEGMEILSVYGTGIKDLSVLTGLEHLTYLNLGGNSPEDWSVIETMTKSGNSGVYNSSISQEQLESLEAALKDCMVSA